MTHSQTTGYFYQGFSMVGLFVPGDYLTIVPLSLAEIRCGDVIVFRQRKTSRPDDTIVVHRVVKTVPYGLITQGDSNRGQDRNVVLEEDIIGRVATVERNGKRRAVRSGLPGLLQRDALRIRRYVARKAYSLACSFLFPLGRWPYRWLRCKRLLGYVWRPEITTIRLDTSHGPVIKYMCGEKNIAAWWVDEQRLVFRRPFDLVEPVASLAISVQRNPRPSPPCDS